ncbi:MAG TPA: hypothetical protein IAC31_01600 [Candidatus Faecousia intestinigallinarum]|nr:hypothetical protein [Candidatus Faecousia intestinigallinarum]
MKRTLSILLLAAILLLTACAPAAAPPTEPVPTLTQPTEPAQTEPTQTDPTQSTEIPRDYAGYFSTIVSKEFQHNQYQSPDYPGDGSYAMLARPNEAELYVGQGVEAGMPLQIDPENGEPKRILWQEPVSGVTLAPDCAILTSQDGTELFSVPYDGGAPTLLYTDEGGGLCAFVEYFDGSVFFAASSGEDSLGIYRLYLPENRLDLLAADIHQTEDYPLAEITVVSNCEVTWTLSCPVLEQYGEALWEEPIIQDGEELVSPKENFAPFSEAETFAEFYETEKVYTAYYRDCLVNYLLEEDGRYSEQHYYVNSRTGQELRCTSPGYTDNRGANLYYVVYPDGTARPDAESKNGSRWWLDGYYAQNG